MARVVRWNHKDGPRTRHSPAGSHKRNIYPTSITTGRGRHLAAMCDGTCQTSRGKYVIRLNTLSSIAVYLETQLRYRSGYRSPLIQSTTCCGVHLLTASMSHNGMYFNLPLLQNTELTRLIGHDYRRSFRKNAETKHNTNGPTVSDQLTELEEKVYSQSRTHARGAGAGYRWLQTAPLSPSSSNQIRVR
ncbi:hypothetical protein NQZ68_022056 [Dissostichus eleginoides]|nr:hypothetical protein NQZ68_022056 [Dissostichus eleginoides]